MNASNKNLQQRQQNAINSKKHWNASLPYPVWPFGTVDPKELAKWARKHRTTTKQATDEFEEALF